VGTSLAPLDTVGPYTLVEKLGSGSMGEVWRARGPDGIGGAGVPPARPGGRDAHPAIQEEFVALKIPRRPAFIRHLRREGVLLAQIKNPHVAAFIACDTDGEVPYLATELVRGESLRGLCRGTISSQSATLLCDQILDGLSAIHAAGILHLDLKPENVLVQRDGSAKIVDLGLGKATSAFMAELYLSASLGSRDLPLAGTLAYMAPEQRKGKPVDARADLFAFGVLLHELLSGRLPDPSTRLSKLRPNLTPRWDVVVAKLTHPDQRERPGSAAEARQLIAFTLHEKATLPVAAGGLEPRDLASFDEDAFAFESPWKAGMVVGDCELEAPLGRGGYGEVWRAKRRLELPQEDESRVGPVGSEPEPPKTETVAVKLAIRDEARDALGKEAALAARVAHAGVPLVLDDRSKEEPPHVVFQLVEGTSLRALINEDGLIELGEALAIMARMADVVRACHAAGVIHRDLKPEHFLVSGHETKLIDFGLAAIVAGPGAHASLASGDARGTFDYMAPEQRDGRDVGTAADVYALGVCFFEMLADELPRGPQSLKQLRREVPDEVDRLVLAMLSKSPQQRPALALILSTLGGQAATPSGRAGVTRRRYNYFAPNPVVLACWIILSFIWFEGADGSVGDRLLVIGVSLPLAVLLAVRLSRAT
jgi:serine/threonine protein kinase